MDIITAISSRGKYARLCAEVDLSKLLIPFYTLEGKRYRVEHEFIHAVCFKCGMVGHRSRLCTRVGWGDPPVSDFINTNGTWDLNSIANVVPRDKVDEISNISLPISTPLEDSMAWEGSGARTFSVGNYYQLIIKDRMDGMVNQHNWKWFWKLKIPARIQHFLWFLGQKKILTNKACMKRGIHMDDLCKSCSHLEDENHNFRDFHVATKVLDLIDPTYLSNFGDDNFEVWLDKNPKCKDSDQMN
ncbi:hypothetical protein LguiA_002828 [Lonicera macranthoides]